MELCLLCKLVSASYFRLDDDEVRIKSTSKFHDVLGERDVKRARIDESIETSLLETKYAAKLS